MKKKLTLLIALSIFIAYTVAPFTVMAFEVFNESKEEKTIVEKVSIKKPQDSKHVEVEKIEEIVEVVPLKSIEEVAKEVILGLWGKGEERRVRLEAAGYNYQEVQNKVNEIAPKPIAPTEDKYNISNICTDFKVPSIYTGFKSWMPYTAITNRYSAQYKLQHSQAYTDENGLRKVGEDYCVAMGTYYSSTIGDRFKITLETGNSFTVIISDIKSNAHTDSSHRYTSHNNCMIEFLVDKNKIPACIKTTGNVGSLSFFSGTIIKVEKLS